MRLRTFIALPLVIALLASVVMTIGVAAQDATPESGDQPAFPVTLKFLNAMTSQSEIDVFINGDDKDQRVVEGLSYGEFSEYFEGTSPATSVIIKNNVNLGFDQWLFNTVIPTEAGKSYLVVVSDLVIIPTLIDTTVLSDNGARVRFIHAAAQAPSIDIVFDGKVVVEGLSYSRASDIGIVTAGTYDIAINEAGSSTVIDESAGVEAEAGKAYTAIVIGEPGSEETPLTTVVDIEDLQRES